MNLPPVFRQRYFDSNGNPLAGGKLYTYASGTSTPQATYTDAGGGAANANPVILDANGEAAVWLDPTLSYKFVLKDSSDVTQWTVDGVVGLLAPDAVSTSALQDSSVTTAKIADDAVTAAKLKDSASTDSDRAVTTDHIRNEAVTRAKLAAGAMGAVDTGVSTETAAFTAAVTKDIYLCDATSAAFTVTLPTAVGNKGKVFVFKKTDSTLNKITLDPNGSETIDGKTTVKLCTQYELFKIVSDGSNWQIIAHFCSTKWTSITMSIASGFGTTSSQTTVARRVGDSLEVRGHFVAGTTGAGSVAFVELPTGYTFDYTKFDTGRFTRVGYQSRGSVGASNNHSTIGAVSDPLFVDGSDNNAIFFSSTSTNASFDKANVNTIFGNNELVGYNFTVPISDWEP